MSSILPRKLNNDWYWQIDKYSSAVVDKMWNDANNTHTHSHRDTARGQFDTTTSVLQASCNLPQGTPCILVVQTSKCSNSTYITQNTLWNCSIKQIKSLSRDPETSSWLRNYYIALREQQTGAFLNLQRRHINIRSVMQPSVLNSQYCCCIAGVLRSYGWLVLLWLGNQEGWDRQII